MSYLAIDTKEVKPVVEELNVLLADYNIYYQNLRGFHWNVLGKNFFDLHEKFEELYTDARIKIDEIAERILTLRHHPESLFTEYFKLSKVKETSSLISDQKMVEHILTNHESILKQMNKVIKKADEAGDEGTIDMMGGYIASLEKVSWMLDAWTKDTRDQL
ncbi:MULTISPECIES: Dps family protein [Maribacter]|uniref:DNA starvation/stationary phase protection protein n=1 Tax=Maribacter flavus TaxID=1658664 RepID=A0ABU7IG82_9FLAO|nr:MULTISPECIES: DNA starvation/stationary phase protection protein [Maribacter]MDC6405234.1 DNA starvation/stationary phase protection protein [Maribacter sp. PR66]MEE1971957.1 DNA starvation/stationary phase protection protein [Maribacter flavus]